MSGGAGQQMARKASFRYVSLLLRMSYQLSDLEQASYVQEQ